MDNVTVDLGPETDVAVGDEAVLIGEAGERPDPVRGGGRAARHDQLRGHLRARARGSCVSTVIEPLTEGWLVGGAIRDRLLGRPVRDMDVVVEGDPEEAARAVAAAQKGPVFPLSEAFGAWRVLSRDRRITYDFSPLQGTTIEEDLAKRDFTVNAMAQPIGGGARHRPPRRPAGPEPGPAARGGSHARTTTTPCGPCAWCASPPSWASGLDGRDRAAHAGGRAAAVRALARAGVRRAAAARDLGRLPRRARAGRASGRARGRPARADRAAGHRAEPLPPSRRLPPHDGGPGCSS